MLKTFHQEILIEAGCDEAGRGSYAGPVFAAAVVLSVDFFHPLLNDSKQVTVNIRRELRVFIEQYALDFAVAMVDNEEIDRINILRASFRAMHIAISQLKKQPQFLLIDGNRFTPYRGIPHYCIVKGDENYSSIAAASILAKTYRDDYMEKLHDEFPHYCWKNNKGYGTEEHRRNIEEFGLCKYHRKSYNIHPVQSEMFE